MDHRKRTRILVKDFIFDSAGNGNSSNIKPHKTEKEVVWMPKTLSKEGYEAVHEKIDKLKQQLLWDINSVTMGTYHSLRCQEHPTSIKMSNTNPVHVLKSQGKAEEELCIIDVVGGVDMDIEKELAMNPTPNLASSIKSETECTCNLKSD